jgi:hypothetical protein
MVRAWHGRGMAGVHQTRPHCVNQMGKTHSKPLAARHGSGTAWARHAMCESALRRWSAASRLLGLRVRISCGSSPFVYVVLLGSGLCDELITLSEEPYRVCMCVAVCDLGTSKMRCLRRDLFCNAPRKGR